MSPRLLQPGSPLRSRKHWGNLTKIQRAACTPLLRAYHVGIERSLRRAVYVRAMFSTGHDAANRAVFKAEPADTPDLVGVALRGAKRDVDKATKGLALHP